MANKKQKVCIIKFFLHSRIWKRSRLLSVIPKGIKAHQHLVLNFGGYGCGELSTIPLKRPYVLVRCCCCKQQACHNEPLVEQRHSHGVLTDTYPKPPLKYSLIIKFFPEIFQVLCRIGSEKNWNLIIKSCSITAHFQLKGTVAWDGFLS